MAQGSCLYLVWSLKSLPFFCDLQSDDEREMCARTIYCTNIDKKVCYLHSCYHQVFILSLFNFNICTYCRSLRQIWNYSLSLYVERLVILYFKHNFPSVQFVLLNVCRNDNSTSTVSLAHCNDCYRSFDWGCLVTTIILLASLLWNLWWLASIPSSYLCNFFEGNILCKNCLQCAF
jgi:hypothetical protein